MNTFEQEEYSNEGIDWSYIEYIDNQDVLELIEKVKIIVFFTIIVLKRDINLLWLLEIHDVNVFEEQL